MLEKFIFAFFVLFGLVVLVVVGQIIWQAARVVWAFIRTFLVGSFRGQQEEEKSETSG